MARLAYVNGRYLPHHRAAVHIEDRGYQFGDGVYEVVTVVAGNMVDEGPHLDRLERSLSQISMAMPMSRRALDLVGRELVRRNGVRNGILYIQVTRGVAPRDHKFPKNTRPALVMTTKHIDFNAQPKFRQGVAVITIKDQRWARRDIKTIGLLANCLGKQLAAESGAYEAWQVDEEGMVTEGTSSNAWIVTDDGRLITRQLGNEILHGVTRRTVLTIAAGEGMAFDERPFTLDEAKRAAEAFVTSATSFITPVVRIDDTVIGNGKPGTLSKKFLKWYQEYAEGKGDFTSS